VTQKLAVLSFCGWIIFGALSLLRRRQQRLFAAPAGAPAAAPHLCDQAALHQVPHPLGWLLAFRQRQLDLQDGVREARDLSAVDGQRGVPEPAGAVQESAR
jgi:hypothetical protein